MIIYNKTWLSNLLIIDLVEKEYENGRLPLTDLNKIKEQYPIGFYSPNFFIRVGLFVLTLIISLSAAGFLSLLFESVIGYGWLIFLGVLNYVALNVLVRKNFHFRSGVDDALLWVSFGYFVAAYAWASDTAHLDSGLIFSSIVFALSLYFTVRFSDMIMSMVAYLAFIGIIFFGWQKAGYFGIATMPFVLMVFSGLSYWLIFRNVKNNKTLFYTNCLNALQVISLITLYASGNYYVVKELGDLLNNTTSEHVPFGWLFWVLTVVLPLSYIYLGLIRKDIIPLRIGLILCIATAATIRIYYHQTALELLLIFGGTLTLAISWALTSYLKTPKHGFTYEDQSNNSLMDQLKIESFIIAESSSGIGTPPSDIGTQMGGGKFGGGGASGGF